jgi:hypothetical protein
MPHVSTPTVSATERLLKQNVSETQRIRSHKKYQMATQQNTVQLVFELFVCNLACFKLHLISSRQLNCGIIAIH